MLCVISLLCNCQFQFLSLMNFLRRLSLILFFWQFQQTDLGIEGSLGTDSRLCGSIDFDSIDCDNSHARIIIALSLNSWDFISQAFSIWRLLQDSEEMDRVANKVGYIEVSNIRLLAESCQADPKHPSNKHILWDDSCVLLYPLNPSVPLYHMNVCYIPPSSDE